MAVECWSATTATGLVRAVVTDRDDGDFHLTDVDAATIESRRRSVVDRPWIYRFDIDRRPDGPVHVLADSIPLPAGSVGASVLQSFDVVEPCNDVIVTVS